MKNFKSIVAQKSLSLLISVLLLFSSIILKVSAENLQNQKLIENHVNEATPDGTYPFFSLISRMKYVNRWHTFNNSKYENLEEHSFETAVIVHALATISNTYYNGNLNPEHLATLALFHDATETITGDLPSPIHYNKNIKNGFAEIEKAAAKEMSDTLPPSLKDTYYDLLMPEKEPPQNIKFLKAADRISALIKCLNEKAVGNRDYLAAEKGIIKSLHALNMPEVEYFLEKFMPGFGYVDVK